MEHKEAELINQEVSHILQTDKPPRQNINKKEFAAIKEIKGNKTSR